MKKYFFALLFIFMTFSGFSQTTFEYGLKGGINYSMGGEIRGSKSNANYWGETVQGVGGIGYHGGIFGQVNFGKFFIRPEVVYSSLTQEFEIPLREDNTEYSVQTFTIPLLLGYNIYGPLDVYAGPVYSNVLDAKIYGEQNDQLIVVQNTPINAQAGVKVEVGRFGIDVRYEHSLSTAERQDIDLDNNLFGGPNGGANKGWFNDARLNQVIVSIIFKIGGPGLNERRRRACY
ncbi:Outer membrane protein beta-barrel domain-containing protein [Salinimicrobium sediminis]|uniref:Outer membrane protein beta-barrel domain-containing protein n=1 Tax=Salinimicrobium sediminis TaxID=1343891 RepID=A0A285X2J6_9FLAO|nr:outer membrane beta-barrel protein [Salinimicrobium sediminis]SOC78589.1 Outer membrane protein beta-barrel domain-containing protein [Salinimicrobium sediminis]